MHSFLYLNYFRFILAKLIFYLFQKTNTQKQTITIENGKRIGLTKPSIRTTIFNFRRSENFFLKVNVITVISHCGRYLNIMVGVLRFNKMKLHRQNYNIKADHLNLMLNNYYDTEYVLSITRILIVIIITTTRVVSSYQLRELFCICCYNSSSPYKQATHVITYANST